MLEIAVFTGRDRVFDTSCTSANQDVAHQHIEPMSFHVSISHFKGSFLIDYLLGVILSNFPLSLHLFDLTFHNSFMLLSLLDLFDFTIECFM